MFEQLRLDTGKRSLTFNSPILNTAGTLGFAQEAANLVPINSLGAFFTNPISLRPRSAAADSRAFQFGDTWLLHSGHPNPGLNSAVTRFRRQWSVLKVPVVVHLIGHSPREYEQMILALEAETAVDAIELGLEAADLATLDPLVHLSQGSELPIILRLPLDTPIEAFQRAADLGALALSLGPPRGALQDERGVWLNGRLYGPSLFALLLAKLDQIRQCCQIPIIAAGGIHTNQHIVQTLNAGASALQLDYALWANPELAAYSQ